MQIGDRTFPSQQAVKEHCKGILSSYVPGSTVSNNEHIEFLAAMLDRHPDRDLKVGAGIRSFEVERTQYGNHCFWLTRADGSRTDWSAWSCLRPMSPKELSTSAFRNAIHQQVAAFKALQSFPMACPFTGERLTADTCDVDHEVPFAALLESFVTREGLELERIETRAHQDGDTFRNLANEGLCERWQLFHRVNARLRIVSRKANRSILRRQGALKGHP